MNSFDISRRALLAGAVALSTPAAALSTATAATPPSSPFALALARHLAAEERFNGLDPELERYDPARHAAEEQRLSDPWEPLVHAEPANWDEFTQKLAVITGGGQFGVDDDVSAILLRDAQRLANG